MDTLILDLIARGGYVGIFLLMALENIVPPIPSEVIMGIGGLLVKRGDMSFWPLLFIATAGTTAGNYFWYWLGNRYGYERLEPFVARWGRWLTVDWQHIQTATDFFRRHGHWVIFFFRFSPFLRTIISLPAGMVAYATAHLLQFYLCGVADLEWAADQRRRVAGALFSRFSGCPCVDHPWNDRDWTALVSMARHHLEAA